LFHALVGEANQHLLQPVSQCVHTDVQANRSVPNQTCNGRSTMQRSSLFRAVPDLVSS
jgi:hypothetical protein